MRTGCACFLYAQIREIFFIFLLIIFGPFFFVKDENLTLFILLYIKFDISLLYNLKLAATVTIRHFKMKTLNRYRPAGLDQTIVDSFGTEVFFSDELKIAIFYTGKSSKCLWHLRFGDAETMHKRIKIYAETWNRRQNEKLERLAAQKILQQSFNAADHFAVGDVVVNTWGYEQTNVDFYQVIEVTAKKIKVQEIMSKEVEGSMYAHGMACELLPSVGNFLEKKLLLSLKASANAEGEISAIICNPESYYYFRKFTGKPEYCSWYY
jgi:hypothetical protein